MKQTKTLLEGGIILVTAVAACSGEGALGAASRSSQLVPVVSSSQLSLPVDARFAPTVDTLALFRFLSRIPEPQRSHVATLFTRASIAGLTVRDSGATNLELNRILRIR